MLFRLSAFIFTQAVNIFVRQNIVHPRIFCLEFWAFYFVELWLWFMWCAGSVPGRQWDSVWCNNSDGQWTLGLLSLTKWLEHLQTVRQGSHIRKHYTADVRISCLIYCNRNKKNLLRSEEASQYWHERPHPDIGRQKPENYKGITECRSYGLMASEPRQPPTKICSHIGTK